MTEPTLVITCVRMLHFTRRYKTLFKRYRWFWCHFFPNLLGYMCTNNYFNKERFDKVIAKIKWCSFFAPQCSNLLRDTQASCVLKSDDVIRRSGKTCWWCGTRRISAASTRCAFQLVVSGRQTSCFTTSKF